MLYCEQTVVQEIIYKAGPKHHDALKILDIVEYVEETSTDVFG